MTAHQTAGHQESEHGSPDLAGATVSGRGLPTRHGGEVVARRSPPCRISDKSRSILRAVQAEPHRTLESFGQQFGVTRERVRQIVGRVAPKPKAQTLRSEARKKAHKAARAAKRAAKVQKWAVALALHQRGMTYAQIGAELGISPMTAWRQCLQARAEGVVIER